MHQPGKLYLIPCPLFPDTQFEVLPVCIPEKIKTITHYLVENERTARRFISSLKTGVIIEDLTFTLLDKDTEAKTIEPVFKLIKQGTDVGVISEAGCPGIADPGALAVALAHKQNIEVIPLTGPSSILLALMGSGFNGQRFAFHGYLPIEKVGRQKAIKQLEKESFRDKQTQIFIETPYRNNSMLADMLAVCEPGTKLCIAVDLTGPAQFLVSKTINDWKGSLPDLNKKPAVFLLLS